MFFSRCIAITEPLKPEPKCQELWTALLQRLRNLLLQAYNRHLSKYEENMRFLRENRNDPGWGFIPFFLIQVCIYITRQTLAPLQNVN